MNLDPHQLDGKATGVLGAPSVGRVLGFCFFFFLWRHCCFVPSRDTDREIKNLSGANLRNCTKSPESHRLNQVSVWESCLPGPGRGLYSHLQWHVLRVCDGEARKEADAQRGPRRLGREAEVRGGGESLARIWRAWEGAGSGEGSSGRGAGLLAGGSSTSPHLTLPYSLAPACAATPRGRDSHSRASVSLWQL